MKNFPYILFDLDGTLIDSGEGIINSAAYALEHMGIPLPEDRRELGRFVGPRFPSPTRSSTICLRRRRSRR